MTSFGLLCEGVRDQAVIEEVLVGYFQGRPGVIVTPVFPPSVAAGELEVGGWTVLKQFFRAGDHQLALEYNDYLVVHIDTDVCEDKGYDVPRKDPTTGADRTADELRAAAIERLAAWMGEGFIEMYGDRVLFAVSVDTIECWLLPLLVSQKATRQKTTGCLDAANHALKRAGRAGLKRGADDPIQPYRDAARPYRKRKMLMAKGPLNPSLAAFLADLDDRGIEIEADDEDG